MRYFLVLTLFLTGCGSSSDDSDFVINKKPKHAIEQCVSLSTEKLVCRTSVLVDKDKQPPLEEIDICFMVWANGFGKYSTGHSVNISCDQYELIKAQGVDL